MYLYITLCSCGPSQILLVGTSSLKLSVPPTQTKSSISVVPKQLCGCALSPAGSASFYTVGVSLRPSSCLTGKFFARDMIILYADDRFNADSMIFNVLEGAERLCVYTSCGWIPTNTAFLTYVYPNHRSLVWSQLSVDKWWLGRKQLPGSEARGALEFVQSVRKGYNPKEEGREDGGFFLFC